MSSVMYPTYDGTCFISSFVIIWTSSSLSSTVFSRCLHFTVHLSKPMQQNPSREANMSSGSYRILLILYNPNVRYRIHKRPPLVPMRSQINPLYNCTFHILKMCFNNIFPPTLKISKWYLSLSYPHQIPTCICPVSHTCHIFRLSHS